MADEKVKLNRVYKDIDMAFGLNPVSSDIGKKIDVNAVKQSMQNLLMTLPFERPFHPEIGSNLRAMLFENITPQMNHVISKQIDLLIRNFEPRCRLVQVNTQPMFDRNGYRAQISFYVVNHPEPVEVETFLERLR